MAYQFKKLVENVLRMPELLSDSRFTNNQARVENRGALVKIITDVLMQNTRDHWLSEFKGLG
jgi:succinate--hydroxymethylglutarate CoA-transferase